MFLKIFLNAKGCGYFSKNGHASAKSAYKAILEEIGKREQKSNKMEIFLKISSQQRVLLFGWKCLQRAIAIRCSWTLRFLILVIYLFIYCNKEVETIEHMHFSISFSWVFQFGFVDTPVLENGQVFLSLLLWQGI